MKDDLSSLVTILIVTSPTASNPSTEMIDRCLLGIISSFPQLKDCKVIVACDGVHVVENNPTSEHNHNRGVKRIFGKCTDAQLAQYEMFCHRLKSRPWMEACCSNEWQGFALILKMALSSVTTPLIMVSPHDYELTPSTLQHVHLPTLLRHTLLDQTFNANYIGLPNPRSSKFGSRHRQALNGIPSRSILTDDPSVSYTLEPLAMWKENPHFATMEAYKSIVYVHNFKRGQFIEDTLGQEMLRDLKQRGIMAFHETYILSLPTPCSFHMDGPRYLPIAERLARGYNVRNFEIEAAKRVEEFVLEQNKRFS